MTATIITGDCLDELSRLDDASVHAVITDPPYGLSNTDPAHVVDALTRWASGDRDYLPSGKGFMGKAWDSFVPPPAVWDECLRVLKPGGHLLAFAGSRTFDLMTLSIRFAGFDIRDSIAWLYGSGFPKSMDVSKAIESHVVSGKSNSRSLRETEQAGDGPSYTLTGKNNGIMGEVREYDRKAFAPDTDAARRWQGWGTALKPAFEPIVVARKPLESTVAANVLAHGTGAMNIDAGRITATDSQLAEKYASVQNAGPRKNSVYGSDIRDRSGAVPNDLGRWPANVILDESQAAVLDEQSGTSKSRKGKPRASAKPGDGYGMTATGAEYDDEGGASRFFYVAKAPKSERPVVDGVAHPTVKPLTLMRYLVKLVTPPGGVVLDPFAGSGTTVEAALLEGFDVTAVEREQAYMPLIAQRVERVRAVAETSRTESQLDFGDWDVA